jgi:hypothetical protein
MWDKDCQADRKYHKIQCQMLINPLGKVKLLLATNGTGQVPLQCSPHQADTRAADKIKESVQSDV